MPTFAILNVDVELDKDDHFEETLVVVWEIQKLCF